MSSCKNLLSSIIRCTESLFSASASNERKYWGFVIFQRVLPRVKSADLPMLFTKNFMRTWINHLSQFDRYLHSFAKQIASPHVSYFPLYMLIVSLAGEGDYLCCAKRPDAWIRFHFTTDRRAWTPTVRQADGNHDCGFDIDEDERRGRRKLYCTPTRGGRRKPFL